MTHLFKFFLSMFWYVIYVVKIFHYLDSSFLFLRYREKNHCIIFNNNNNNQSPKKWHCAAETVTESDKFNGNSSDANDDSYHSENIFIDSNSKEHKIQVCASCDPLKVEMETGEDLKICLVSQ